MQSTLCSAGHFHSIWGAPPVSREFNTVKRTVAKRKKPFIAALAEVEAIVICPALPVFTLKVPKLPFCEKPL